MRNEGATEPEKAAHVPLLAGVGDPMERRRIVRVSAERFESRGYNRLRLGPLTIAVFGTIVVSLAIVRPLAFPWLTLNGLPREVAIGTVVVIGAMVVNVAHMLSRGRRHRQCLREVLREMGRCASCGYPLVRDGVRCPECGSKYE